MSNMRFSSLGSGSSGNCLFVETKHTRFLIDAGFSGKQIEMQLRAIDVDPKTIDYILVTHEHQDHIKGVGIFARRYRIPVVANYGTWKAMETCVGNLPEDLKLVFDSDKPFSIQDADIIAPRTSHDSAESCAYIIQSENKKISVVTDTGIISENLQRHLKGSDVLFIEANHDVEMLEKGPYPMHLVKRIRSAHGHLSNEECARTLLDVMKGNGETILLGHLSHENNIPLLAMDTITNILQDSGVRVQKDIRMSTAKRNEHSGVVIL